MDSNEYALMLQGKQRELENQCRVWLQFNKEQLAKEKIAFFENLAANAMTRQREAMNTAYLNYQAGINRAGKEKMEHLRNLALRLAKNNLETELRHADLITANLKNMLDQLLLA